MTEAIRTWNNCCPDCAGEAVGVSVRGVYEDGALFYSCKECGRAWQRWASKDMQEKAQPWISKINAARRES